MAYLLTTKSTDRYHIEKNLCMEKQYGNECFDYHCIKQRHTWWVVNEIQGEFGEVVFEAPSYSACRDWALAKYGV